MQTASELETIYRMRFETDGSYRTQIWKIIVSEYICQYVDPSAVVLDLGCGYGEFINNITCRQRYALDLNPRAGKFVDRAVTFFQQSCTEPWPIPEGSLDVIFTSNFFEHLPSKKVLGDVLEVAHRHLKPNGRIIAMGPNIKYVGGAYWDFWDHHIALTDASLTEGMLERGFRIDRVIDRFLPYTMVKRRPVPSRLVSLYLRMPLLWRLFGRQFLIIASRED